MTRSFRIFVRQNWDEIVTDDVKDLLRELDNLVSAVPAYDRGLHQVKMENLALPVRPQANRKDLACIVIDISKVIHMNQDLRSTL